MNLNQKRTLIAVAVIIAGMMLYPPFHKTFSGNSIGIGYYWLFEPPHYSRRATIDIATLLIQWLGVLVIGGIVFFIFKDNEK